MHEEQAEQLQRFVLCQRDQLREYLALLDDAQQAAPEVARHSQHDAELSLEVLERAVVQQVVHADPALGAEIGVPDRRLLLHLLQALAAARRVVAHSLHELVHGLPPQKTGVLKKYAELVAVGAAVGRGGASSR